MTVHLTWARNFRNLSSLILIYFSTVWLLLLLIFFQIIDYYEGKSKTKCLGKKCLSCGEKKKGFITVKNTWEKEPHSTMVGLVESCLLISQHWIWPHVFSIFVCAALKRRFHYDRCRVTNTVTNLEVTMQCCYKLKAGMPAGNHPPFCNCSALLPPHFWCSGSCPWCSQKAVCW